MSDAGMVIEDVVTNTEDTLYYTPAISLAVYLALRPTGQREIDPWGRLHSTAEHHARNVAHLARLLGVEETGGEFIVIGPDRGGVAAMALVRESDDAWAEWSALRVIPVVAPGITDEQAGADPASRPFARERRRVVVEILAWRRAAEQCRPHCPQWDQVLASAIREAAASPETSKALPLAWERLSPSQQEETWDQCGYWFQQADYERHVQDVMLGWGWLFRNCPAHLDQP